MKIIIKKPKIGDKRTIKKFCLLPYKIYSDDASIYVWLSRIEIEQEYMRICLRDDGFEDKWTTVSTTF